MKCIGHRGAAGLAPQNTLASIRTAIACGCRHIEIDIWKIEGELIVFHDRRLERLTGTAGLLSEQSLASLALLRVDGKEPIPTLKEVLDVCAEEIAVNIELKGPGTAHALSEFLITQGETKTRMLVSSFDHLQLEEFHALQPTISCGVLIHGYPNGFMDFARRIGARSIHLHIDFAHRKIIEAIRAQGMKVFIYTVNHEDDIRAMQQLGVDAVFSDFPDRVFALCGPNVQDGSPIF